MKLYLFILLIFCLPTYAQKKINQRAIKLNVQRILEQKVGTNTKMVSWKPILISKISTGYLAEYDITYPDLNYTSRINVFISNHYKLTDSSFLDEIPDYVLNHTQPNLISADSAVSIAKLNGLCNGDEISPFLIRHYSKKNFIWIVNSDWKKERLAVKREYKNKVAIRSTSDCKEKVVNATSGQVILDINNF